MGCGLCGTDSDVKTSNYEQNSLLQNRILEIEKLKISI